LTTEGIHVGTKRRPRVVIADDDDKFASGLATLLEADGRVEVIGIAGNGQEAVELACWQDPDIVVMDFQMPVLDGIKATRLVRQSRARVCVLMISGSTTKTFAERAVDAGAAACISKDRIPAELVETILDICSEADSSRQRASI
jgi:DNA-binding NarL/FixJ family response regulator